MEILEANGPVEETARSGGFSDEATINDLASQTMENIEENGPVEEPASSGGFSDEATR
jgi:hypothetical protein